MIVVDTSVWIDHLRRGRRDLASCLEKGAVACHPFVVGELNCGSLSNRDEIVAHLRTLTSAVVADQDEAMHLLDHERLHGQGLGWIDVHLLASARLSGYRLWTLDKALARAATRLDLHFEPSA